MLATGMKPRLEGQFRRKNHYVALLCVDVYPIRDGFPYGLRLETGGQMKRLVILCLVFVGCASESRMPSVVEGALKIREIPEKNLSLSGQWAFCPNALLPGHDFASEMPGHCSFQTIPDSWTRYPAPWGMKGTGVATYRMILEIPEDLSADLALYMPFQGTAYELWVNGEVLARNGTVARNPAKRQAAMLPQMVRLPDAPVIELVLHISNGHDKSGGMWNAPLLGPAQSIEDYVHRTVILDSLMTGMLLLATGFSFALFLLNTQDRASLFFGFFALFAMLRQISTNSHIILHLMPDFPFGVYYRLEFLGILLSPAAFLHSLNHLFPGTMHRFALRGLTAIFVFFCADSDLSAAATLYEYCSLEPRLSGRHYGRGRTFDLSRTARAETQCLAHWRRVHRSFFLRNPRYSGRTESSTIPVSGILWFTSFSVGACSGAGAPSRPGTTGKGPY
ncbi:MAG: hypothetical protein CMN76_12205 [Spirochaetaceae bacterium]|nr:hypothetical protein [Spirochaetaceae bacterium]